MKTDISLWFGVAAVLLCGLAGQARGETIAVITDLNGSYGSTRYHARVDAAVAAIVELQPDVVLSAGDMVAGQRQPLLSREQVRAMWASFHQHVTDPLAAAGIPLAVTPGNHDGSAYPVFAAEREIFVDEWSTRRPAVEFVAADSYPLNYAVAVGKVLIIGLDVTTVSPLPMAQREFLEAVLAAHGERFDTRIVFCHLPLWPFAQGRETEILRDSRLAQQLAAHDVAMLVSGHHHVFYPGIDDNGVLHVSAGVLGGNIRRFSGSDIKSEFSFVLIEIDNGVVSVSARAAPDFERQIDSGRLPRQIAGPDGELQRYEPGAVARSAR
ncbi:MAG: metallophosphoesterase [Chromatiales bacterium]|nr:metallophosphoesterase [Chromatiales bacterium]